MTTEGTVRKLTICFKLGSDWSPLKLTVVNTGLRGTTEIGSAQFLPFNFENCYATMLTVAHRKTLKSLSGRAAFRPSSSDPEAVRSARQSAL
jgi:hypothetical protein